MKIEWIPTTIEKYFSHKATWNSQIKPEAIYKVVWWLFNRCMIFMRVDPNSGNRVFRLWTELNSEFIQSTVNWTEWTRREFYSWINHSLSVQFTVLRMSRQTNCKMNWIELEFQSEFSELLVNWTGRKKLLYIFEIRIKEFFDVFFWKEGSPQSQRAAGL